MQTNMTDKNILKSVSNLDRRRLFSNIYENIHGLASLLNINDQLVNPVEDIGYKPQCKLWKGYETHLLSHIWNAYDVWYNKHANKKITNYNDTVNYQNILKICKIMRIIGLKQLPDSYPDWCSDECIISHKFHLMAKNKNYYQKLWPDLYERYLDEFIGMRYDWS